jgi:hypothetical protein
LLGHVGLSRQACGAAIRAAGTPTCGGDEEFTQDREGKGRIRKSDVGLRISTAAPLAKHTPDRTISKQPALSRPELDSDCQRQQRSNLEPTLLRARPSVYFNKRVSHPRCQSRYLQCLPLATIRPRECEYGEYILKSIVVCGNPPCPLPQSALSVVPLNATFLQLPPNPPLSDINISCGPDCGGKYEFLKHSLTEIDQLSVDVAETCA